MNATADLTPMHVGARTPIVRARLNELAVETLVVTNTTNIRWLTGFTGSNGVVVLTPTAMVLITDGRYADQAPEQLSAAGVDAEIVIDADVLGAVGAHLGGAYSVGLEADHITWDGQQKLAGKLSGELKPLSGELVRLRARKDAGELDRVRRAAEIADSALAEVAPLMADAPTERDVALALDTAMRSRGATAAAYETIVASGPNGALPHARPTDRTIVEGDLIVIDVGAVVDGYRSDMTRSFVVGDPTPQQQRQLDVVLEAQAAGAAAVMAGVGARDVDAACRSVIDDAGWGDRFTHGTGHGVGIDIHEHPRLNRVTTDVLEAGMLVTVEPGVYLPGVGGVRWEDLIQVTDTGGECLSGSPKSPLIAV